MVKLHIRCLRCGRKLKNIKYQLLGFGLSCYKKHLKENIVKPKLLFSINNIKKL